MSKTYCPNEYKEIQPEYVYMTIPAEYVCIYHKILVLFADFGKEMLDDCKAACTDNNKNIVNCFNMFNAAVAARKLEQYKLAAVLIKQIEAQLNLLYKGESPCPDIIFPVDEEGKINAIVGCGDKPRFYIDEASGELWEEINPEHVDDFCLDESDLGVNLNDSFTG